MVQNWRSWALTVICFSFLYLNWSYAQSESGSMHAASPAARRATDYSPHSILVRYKPDASARREAKMHASRGTAVAHQFEFLPGLRLLQLPDNVSVAQAVEVYSADPDVLYAEPDYTIHAFDKVANDPRFGSQWNLQNLATGADIKATKVWDLTTGSSNVVVGVIDSGVQAWHPDLSANLLTPVSKLLDGSSVNDDAGHGTHVAGIIGAVGNNQVGVAGVDWAVSMLSCKFIGADGTGPTSAAIACLDYLAQQKDQGLNLIATNNSWGSIGYSQALYEAIQAHLKRGILFVAAAGNGDAYGNGLDNDQLPHYPASYDLDNIISVAATSATDGLGSFSNFGDHSVHLGAPGVSILSTVPDWAGSYYTLSGTSMAAPHVTGVAALLKAANPALTWWQIRNLILTSGDPTSALARTITGRRLNAYSAATCSSKSVQKRMWPRRDIVPMVIGESLSLKVLNANCSEAAGSVTITGPGGSPITLHDDGQSGDSIAGDGIDTATWKATEAGTFQFTFPSNDVVTVKVLKVYGVDQLPTTYESIGGTSLAIKDETFATLTLPFPVRFGGQTFTKLYVSENGYLSFDSRMSVGLGFPIPYPSFGTIVAPFWDDLNTTVGSGNNVFWASLGAAPNRKIVLEWRNVSRYPFTAADGAVKFQVVFNESTDEVQFNYADPIFGGPFTSYFDRGAQASVGVQTTDHWGTQFSFDKPSLSDGLSLNWTPREPDFALTFAQNEQTVFLHGSAAYVGTVTSQYGFVGDVSVACQVDAPASCTGGTVTASNRGANLSINAGATVVGAYTLLLQATGPAESPVTRTQTLKFNMVDFFLGAPSSTNINVPNGTSASFTIPVGFGGPITAPAILSCAGLPPGAACQFSPSAEITPSAEPTIVTVSVALAPATTVGNYNMKVIANEPGATYTREQPITLVVQPNADFYLTTSTPVIAGSTPRGIVTVNQQDGYSGTVNLSCTVVPSGPTCEVSPQSLSTVPGTAAVVITLDPSAAGDYTVTVKGSDDKHTHSVDIAIQLVDFVATVLQPNTVVYGLTPNYVDIELKTINGYTGTITVECDASALGQYASCNSSAVYFYAGGQTSARSNVLLFPGSSSTWSGSYPVTLVFRDVEKGIEHRITANVTPRIFTIAAEHATTYTLYPGQVSDPVPYVITPINGFDQKIDFSSSCYNCGVLNTQTYTPNGSPFTVFLTLTGPVSYNPAEWYTSMPITFIARSTLPSAYLISLNSPPTILLLKDFGLSTSSVGYNNSLSVVPGQSKNLILNYKALNGFDRPVSIACPAQIGVGLHCAADKSVLLPGESATFTFSADAGTANSFRRTEIAGAATLEDGRQIDHKLGFQLVVSTIGMTIQPASAKVPAGGSARYTVDFGGSNYTGSGSLSCSSPDPGITCTGVPNAGAPGMYPIEVSTTDGITSPGSHSFTVTFNGAENDTASVTGTIEMKGHDSLTLLSPMAGELWDKVAHNIQWAYTGDPGTTVKLELIKGGMLDRLIADNVPVGTDGQGTYSWSVPSDIKLSKQYGIRITSDSAANISDSVQVFVGTGVEFVVPDSGTVLLQGNYLLPRYSWAGDPNIRLDLYKGGKLLKRLENNSESLYLVRTGCWCMSTLGYTGSDTPPGNDYTVVATQGTNSFTSSSFTIARTAMTIVSPQGGEIWHPGETHTIQWTWSADYIQIPDELQLTLEGGPTGYAITPSTSLGTGGNGSYTFTLPANIAASTTYKVHASTYGNIMFGAWSAQTFAIGDYNKVSVQIVGNGLVNASDYSISCATACSHFYTSGTTITLHPASSGFTGWSGSTCSGLNDCTFTITKDVDIVANFGGQDFNLSPSGAPIAPIKAGNSAQFSFTIWGTPGFTSPVVLTCSGWLPSGTSCTFDQNNFVPSTTSTTINGTFHTTARTTASLHDSFRPFTELMVLGSVGLIGMLAMRRKGVAAGTAGLIIVMLLVSCGGGGGRSTSQPPAGGGSTGTPAGSYAIQVTASTGTTTKIMTLQVIVQ